MIILYALVSILAIVLAVGFFVVKRNKSLIAAAEQAENEHKEWLVERRANMTQEQRDSEDLYYSKLRAMPPSEVFKPRTGNSLSKDLLGFDLLPK